MIENITNKKFWSNNWVVGILTSLITSIIILVIGYFTEVINIIPLVKESNRKIDSLSYAINDLKLCIKPDDKKGILIKVGVSSELKGNKVSCFEINNQNFKLYDRISLKYVGHENGSNPQVEVMFEVVEKKKSEDNRIFISKELADQLGIPYLGIYEVYYKIIDKAVNE